MKGIPLSSLADANCFSLVSALYLFVHLFVLLWQIICEINFMQTCRQNTTTWQFNWTRHVASVRLKGNVNCGSDSGACAKPTKILVNFELACCQRPRTLASWSIPSSPSILCNCPNIFSANECPFKCILSRLLSVYCVYVCVFATDPLYAFDRRQKNGLWQKCSLQ